MKPNLGIPESDLHLVSIELNRLLSDEFILHTKTRNYHWNIEGASFSDLHLFYDRQIDELAEIIDDIAERIRSIGFYAEARLEDYLRLTSLIEQPYTNLQNDQLKYLLGGHETIINNLRRLITLFADKYKDAGSADFVTQLLEKHEKMAWMIRAHFDK
jgi:starvation-inducible DNA-binding protein